MRRLISILDAVHARLGRLIGVLESWRAELDPLVELRSCVGCGEPGVMVCDDCVDEGLCADCGSSAPHFIVRPTGKRVCPKDARPPTGTRAC